ncbi:MAG: mercuric reductase [Propionibacteriaceae bacterium]|nr:mercuric reductase [Propionibacteriaceae bacterium]
MSDRGVEDVDLLVVGGGKAGKSLAMDRAQAGWKVAMVERDKIGGTCINVACIPTKALVGSARTVLMGRHAKVMGVELDDQPLVSLDGLRRHKSFVVDGMVAAHKKMFADSGMDFILGTARFIAPRTVEVETRNEPIRLLRGTNVVINTGTAPTIPDLAGISESRVWTSETILQLERLPQRLIVLGGGYVGCEFASMFALFGIQVTLLQGPSCFHVRIPMSPAKWRASLPIKGSAYDWAPEPRLSVVMPITARLSRSLKTAPRCGARSCSSRLGALR